MNEHDHLDKAHADTADSNGEKPRSIRIDEAIKHLFHSEKQALIRFVNSALGKSYDLDSTELVALNTEFLVYKTESEEGEAQADPFDLEKIQ